MDSLNTIYLFYKYDRQMLYLYDIIFAGGNMKVNNRLFEIEY